MSSEQTLSLRRVGKSFAGRAVVDDISFDVAPGEVVCLLGSSGSGKSTTLRMIAGIERADRGEILIGGKIVDSAVTFVHPENRGVGLVFQDLALFPHLTARANAAFGLFRVARPQAAARADQLLALVGLATMGDRYPHQLSGGEQQRLAVARALAPKPKIMLLDEPFSGLDDRLRDDVRREVLAILRKEGAGTVLVTHDPDEALRSADRIVLMRQGSMAQTGRPADLLNAPADIETAAFFSPITRFDTEVSSGRAITPLGETKCPYLDGTHVSIAFRPRDVELHEQGVPATVSAVATASDGTHLSLALNGSDTPLSAIVETGIDAGLGDKIRIRAKPGRGFVFPRT